MHPRYLTRLTAVIALVSQDAVMIRLTVEGFVRQMTETEITPEFQRGWDAALVAVREWHEQQAKKALVQSRRSRFPKNLEREAEVHTRAAELVGTLSPDDV